MRRADDRAASGGHPADGEPRGWRRRLLVAVVLGALSLAHFLSPPESTWLHDFWFKVTYLPIVLAGLWFGWRGGILVGLITGVIYTIHIRLQLTGHHQQAQLGFWLELILYVLIGATVGWMADRQRRFEEQLRSANARLAGSLTSLKEKTDALLAAEESLRQADRLRAVGELAAGIAHEVRNPLNGILGAARILADPDTDPANRSEFADVLGQETKRLDRVISRLLDLARPPQGRGEVSSLVAEIEFVGQLTAGTRRKTAASYDASGIPRDVSVALSSDSLRQIALNLTLNALAALPAQGGKIVWSAERRGPHVLVRVEDSGGGVDPRVRDHLFEPFVTTGAAEGSGLGLAIVARLIQEAGGEIRLESTGPQGTVFALRLPAAGEQKIDASPEQLEEPA